MADCKLSALFAMVLPCRCVQSEAKSEGPGTFEGPRRFLEWARPIDLYMQYTAFAESVGEEAAGFSTFRRLMKPVFKTHLKFRDKGDFGQCDVCWKLRAKIKRAQTKAQKALLTRTYSKHLLAQWLDRQLYWSLRQVSRHYFAQAWQWASKLQQSQVGSSMITLIQDGMDQAKLRVPRQGYQTISKAMQKLYRPALHLIGTFVHGFKLRIHVTDEDLRKNSETCIECVALALSEVLDSHGRLPLGLHLQQDNCYREGKNGFMLSFFLLLVVLGALRWTSLGFLRTCHSHEDIDQCFGQLARMLMGRAIGSADEMVATISDAIMSGASGSEGRIRGSTAEASKLDETSEWKHFTRQLGLKLKGLRRVHYFRFALRRDLGGDVLDNVQTLEELGAHWPRDESDVFLVTKRWLADKECARAMVVVPSSVATAIRQGHELPHGISPRKTIGEQMRKNLVKHIPPLKRSGELSAEASNYLLSWVSGTLRRVPKPDSYSVLSVLGYRYDERLRGEARIPGSWQVPRRLKHFDLTLEREDLGEDSSDGSASDDAGDLDLPVGFEA